MRRESEIASEEFWSVKRVTCTLSAGCSNRPYQNWLLRDLPMRSSGQNITTQKMQT